MALMIVASGDPNRLHEWITMPEPMPFISIDPSRDVRANSNVGAAPTLPTSNDGWQHRWPSIFFGIIIAGAMYPIVLAAVWVAIGLCAKLLQLGDRVEWDTLFTGIIGLTSYAIMGAAIGLIWSSVVTAFMLPVVHLIAWSLNLRVGLVRFGAFSGGLVGFIAILPMTLQLPGAFNLGPGWEVVAIVLLGPAMTTLLGQLGGAWGGWRADWYERAIALASVGNDQDVSNESSGDYNNRTSHGSERFQFSIRQLLSIAVWFSLLLTLIRLAGIPYEFVLPLLLGWLLYQATTLWLGQLLARRLGPWWNRKRQIRST